VLAGYAVLVGSVFLAGAVLARFIDRRPIAGIGLGFHARWARELGLGFLLGAIFITAVTGTLAAAGWVSVARSGTAAAPWARGFLVQFVLFLEVALLEELLFRGYPLQALAEGIGKAPAAILLSAVFGVIHASNPGGNAVAALSTGCAGLLLSVAYFRTRSLWLPVGIHLAWNFVLGSVLSLPVSGERLSDTYLITEISGPEWMTGGAFGPEAGLPAFAAMGVLAAYLGFSRRVFPAPEAISWYPSPEEPLRSADAAGTNGEGPREGEGSGVA
jgi:membrane protease YdiL (CAAX protease family)